ncbi:hypothetical protein SK128_003564 [Halocaridina rubra]|uniref:Ileal sodium/bile acid cotransporter n=1 Tax=Halocaridina rubra TaxID=373956 RepID=A0AAN8WLY2_HALRR
MENDLLLHNAPRLLDTMRLKYSNSVLTRVDLNVYPSGFWLVPEDANHTLTISLNVNDSNVNNAVQNASSTDLKIKIVPDEDWKLDFVNDSAYFTSEEIAEGTNKSIVFSGFYWQRTQLKFYLITVNATDDILSINGTLLRDDVVIGVTRGQSFVDKIFMTILTTFLLANTINMGCQLNLHIIWMCLKKPLGPLCGFLSQFLVMPLFSYIVGYVLFEDPLFRLGLFTLGCSPGGVMSNFWTLVFDGDINLSITMTFISTVCAMGMMPLWVFTLGKTIFEENNNLKIPFSNLAISLVGLTIPLAIGFIIHSRQSAAWRSQPCWVNTRNHIEAYYPYAMSLTCLVLSVSLLSMSARFIWKPSNIGWEAEKAGCKREHRSKLATSRQSLVYQ